jgi:hypothetical protein
MKRPITQLTVEGFEQYPVWNISEDSRGEIIATPVRRIPVRSLEQRLVGCQVTLSNGQRHWAELSNIDLHHERANSHFLTLSIAKHGKWFHLARYFDADYAHHGPSALSAFLDLPVGEIFPISYDIAPYVVGAKIPTRGVIMETPAVRLSQDELIALSLE